MVRLGSWGIAAALSVLMGACGGLDTVVLTQERSFSLPEPVESPTVRSVPLSFEHAVELPETEVEFDQIDSLRLKRLEIILPKPSPTRNFDFLESLRVYLQTPTRPARLLAEHGKMQEGSSAITLQTRGIELKDYLTAPNAEIRVKFMGIQPQEQLDLRVEADFLVDVRLKAFLFPDSPRVEDSEDSEDDDDE